MAELCRLVTSLPWNFCMTKDSKIQLRRWWCWALSHNADTQPSTFSCGRNVSFSILHKIKLVFWRDWLFIFKSNSLPTIPNDWNSISTSSGRIDLRHWFLRCWIKGGRARQTDPICSFFSHLLHYRNHFYIFQLFFSVYFLRKKCFSQRSF